MENYDHIILTDEEKHTITETALREERKKRHFEIESRKYWAKVNKPVEYPKFDKWGTMQLFKQQVKVISPNFEVNAHNKTIIDLLCAYFAEDKSFEDAGYSFDKGIMLVGPVGCGKTTIMKAFQINTTNPYAVMSARKIAGEYTSKDTGGEHTLNRFSKLIPSHPQKNLGFSQLGLCIDDIGTEDVKKHFGNETDVISEIIFNRYDAKLHVFTHFTANISGEQIENAYGVRIRSRLREMCNVLVFDEQAPDFRK